MKKLFAVLAILCLLCTPLFAAAATVTTTEYGYSITGDTGAVTVASGESVVVKSIIFFANTSTDKAVITTGSTNVSFPTLTNTCPVVFFGDTGQSLKNIKVTLTAGTDIVAIITR